MDGLGENLKGGSVLIISISQRLRRRSDLEQRTVRSSGFKGKL